MDEVCDEGGELALVITLKIPPFRKIELANTEWQQCWVLVKKDTACPRQLVTSRAPP
jgi:hypothetical protein